MTNIQKLRLVNLGIAPTAANFNSLIDLLAQEETYGTNGSLFHTPNRYSTTIGIYAEPGGSQSKAIQLTSEFNTVSVVATAGDSVKLPAAVPGLSIHVKNSGLNILNVYPHLGDMIAGLLVNVPISMNPGDSKVFNFDGSSWDNILISPSMGLTGSNGSIGPVGATGPVGPSGSNGVDGTNGATGSPAVVGVAGAYSLQSAATYVALTGGAITLSNSQLVISSGFIGEVTLNNPNLITFISGSSNKGPSPQPVTDANNLYGTMSVLSANYTFGAVNLETVNAGCGVGRFVPGIYKGTSGITTAASQTITLVGDGDYVFISDAAIVFGANTVIKLVGGARASRVFWVAAGAITTGATNTLKGNFITPVAISIGATNDIEGRIISTITAQITIDGTASLLYLPIN
jgi:hypothetical protein